MQLRLRNHQIELSAWQLTLYRIGPPDELQQAIANNRRSLEEEPKDISTRYALGNCLRMEGRIAEARREYELVASSDSAWAPYAAEMLKTLEGQEDRSPPRTGSLQYVWSKNLWASKLLWLGRLIKRLVLKRQNPPWTTSIVESWRAVLGREHYGWVVFQHGTCIVAEEPQDDLVAYAKEVLAQWPMAVYGGFVVHSLSDYPGWVVQAYVSQMRNYVHPNELLDLGISVRITDERSLRQVHADAGVFVRQKREADGKAAHILHVEPGPKRSMS
jgi:hypothetical protein